MFKWCPAFGRDPEPGAGPWRGTGEEAKRTGNQAAGGGQANAAKTRGLSLAVASPGEGETLYAGPPVLLHVFQVTGSVSGDGHDLSKVELRLDVVSGERTTGHLLTTPLADGSFSFDLTVNQGASTEKFPPERQSCETCHRSGDLDLPQGSSTLRITVTDSTGGQAMVERHIVVDRAGYASVPVRVVIDGNSTRTMAGVPVSGAAWLHLWRTRIGAASTDADGRAQVQVESLAADPTHYKFQVEPTVIDRKIYESTQSVEVDLPAGAASAPPIALTVRSRLGAISGKVKAPGGRQLPALKVSAILLPEGTIFHTETSPAGLFSFSEMPVGDYLVLADQDELASQGLECQAQEVQIPASGRATTELDVGLLDGSPARGALRGDKDEPLPFGWVVMEKPTLTRSANPLTGEFVVPASPRSVGSATVMAPGYFSQERVLDVGAASAARQFNLVRRPETRSVRWGAGEVIVPPESEASVDSQQISISRGWLWGYGGGDFPTVRVGQEAIQVSSGRFALEVLPERDPWLYVTEGRAVVYSEGNGEPIEVLGGQMMALTPDPHRRPVPSERVVVDALHAGAGSPISPAWEPTLSAQVRDRLAEAGIGAVQAVTLATYSLVVLFLVPVPAIGVAWWWKRRMASPAHKPRGDNHDF